MARDPQESAPQDGTLQAEKTARTATGSGLVAWSADALHATILDNCTDAIVAHTLDGELLYANPAALVQWKCSTVNEVRDRGPWGWIPSEHRSKTLGRLGRIRLHGEARFDSVSRTCEGGSTSAEVHARYVDSPHGPLVVSVVRDISSRLQSEEMIRYLAYHDNLTGLANRALFSEQLIGALEHARREPRLIGLLYIDLDDFKPVNDVYGHAVGDNVLRKIAGRISACVRHSDTVARIGGDEFTVLLTSIADENELHAIQARIHEAICRPIRVGQNTVAVTPSIGSAIHEPGESLDAFVARADQAMFENRDRTGRAGSIR